MKIEQIRAKIEAKSTELKGLVASDSASTEDITARTAELKGLKAELSAFEAAEAEMVPVNSAPITEVKAENEVLEFKNTLLSGGTYRLDMPLSLKTAMTTSSGHGAPKNYTGVSFQSSPRTALLDAIQVKQFGSVSDLWYLQSTRTNNGAALAEGVAPTDSVLVWTEKNLNAKPVIAWIPVSEAMLRSLSPEALNNIKNDVLKGCRQTVDNEIIDGSVLEDIATLSGILTQANVLEAVTSNILYRDMVDGAIAKVLAAGEMASHLLVNPSDFALIKNGITAHGYQHAAWLPGDTYQGLTVVQDAFVAAGIAYVFASDAVQLGVVGGFELAVGENSADFSAGRKSIRAMVHCNTMLNHNGICSIDLTA